MSSLLFSHLISRGCMLTWLPTSILTLPLLPGRLDRKIEFPLPDRRQKRLIFSTVAGTMSMSDEVDLEDFVARPDKISAADIAAICQEAGMLAVRKNRYVILAKDFEKAYKNVITKDDDEHTFYT